MGLSAQLEELKRDLAALEGHRTRRSGHYGHRGRAAEHPGQIPARGWGDVLWRAWKSVSDADLFLFAGGVTYAILVALFPGLAALVSLYGLVLDPSQIEGQVNALSGVLPAEGQQLLAGQLHDLVAASSRTLGVSTAIGLLLALWSASRGMSGMINALNIAYEEKERRSFVVVNLIAIGLTLSLLVAGIVAIGLIAGLPVAVQVLNLGGATKWLLLVIEWPFLIALLMGSLAILYRYAPSREKPQWSWVSPGAMVATIVWIVASIGFTVYVANFNSYDKTYGSLGSVIILLTWLYLSALVVLLGAVINAQSEKQTCEDSTDGPPKPMGERGAHVADTIGEFRK